MKTALIVVTVAVIAIAGFAIYQAKIKVNVSVIDQDRLIQGDYVVGPQDKIVVKNGSTVTIEGKLTVSGTLTCEGGALNIVAKSGAVINGTLECNRAEDASSADGASGISIVAENGIVFGKDALIVSNSHVQVVDDAEKLATTQDGLNKIFSEAGENTGSGPRIGPLAPAEGSAPSSFIPKQKPLSEQRASGFIASVATGIVTNAFAQAAGAPCVDQAGNPVPNCVQVSGRWVMGDGEAPPVGVSVPTPPKGVHKIILNFNFGPGKEVHLVDFNLSGPDGRAGSDDSGKGCDARGTDGEDAFRLRVAASNITINNFDLWLGNGGNGGNAETTKDCDPGKATGGKGGQAGNFKMSASGSFEIEGAFSIHPGTSGDGGTATAHGKNGENGCPGKKGGDATARSGDGGANKKDLSVAGSVAGTSSITVDEVEGGKGGIATADPGTGGSGIGCGCNGGAGGNGTAVGGKGGDASVKVLGGAGSATGGNGGDVDAHGATAGNGGSCGPEGPGGNGGKGGDAISNKGLGGSGTSAAGSDGTVIDETGGNGGNGGDGCNEGRGGKGGKGNPPGKDGSPGNNTCKKIVPPPATSLPPPPPTSTGGGASSGGGTQTEPPPPSTGTSAHTIQAINYGGKFLPRDQLIIEDEIGCGVDHWHAAQGVVIATDGTPVQDPGPQCGYGKVSDMPLVTVQVY